MFYVVYDQSKGKINTDCCDAKITQTTWSNTT
jgi:hypothetical protein